MTSRTPPAIGQWYRQESKGTLFQVVAVDDDSGAIEIQDADGDVDELEADTWRTGEFQEAAPPEEWMEPLEERDNDDGAGGNSASDIEKLENPLDDGFDIDELE